MIVIFRWIRNQAYPLLFILLFLSSFIQVIQFNIYQNSVFFNQTLGFHRKIDASKAYITQYFNLSNENEKLIAENNLLKQQIQWNLQSPTIKRDTQFLDTNTNTRLRYSYINARVIRSTINKRNNFIVLDKGTESGINENMAVIGPAGIVGIVFKASKNYALVLSVLNSKFEITPYLRDITLNQGVLNWNGNNPKYASLNEVNRFEKVKKGMKLFTSNYSLIFPAGVPIGEIDEINTSLKSNFHEIVVKLSTDFTRLDHVSIVKVVEQEQLQQLDNQINQEENHE